MIEPDATIGSIADKLDNAEKFARAVLGTMHPCLKEHGNAHVRIGITGEGKAPYHKVVYDDVDGCEQLYGSFAGKVMDEKYLVHEDTWSAKRMSYGDVQALIGALTGYSQ
ncbi:hypothetical protein [Erythrobacter sp. EC-HK427]|uniref:hypothetical protein n=1 Tax=Erythrobacter sp. EC-HK427 TaxID=2038396 RepID=UPI00125FA432|nr:hypothetical protein [Erythrobacter sp. EC-HK427]